MENILPTEEYIKEWLNKHFSKTTAVECKGMDGYNLLHLAFNPEPALHYISMIVRDYVKLHRKAILEAVNELDLDDTSKFPEANDYEEGLKLYISSAYPETLIQ